jgi:hypothetical protein
MKPRHAAALALVGWYLMAPPLYKNGKHYIVVRDAPISHWKIDESFDSAAECQQGILDNVRSMRNVAIAAGECSATPGTECNSVLLKRSTLAECIATDDPRLKEN